MSNAEDDWLDDEENKRFEKLDPDQAWDAELASDLVGCTLYVGLTFVAHDGAFQRREQVFGIVESVSVTAGIKLLQTNGEPFTIAPVLDAIEPGDPGRYQLTEEDEMVEDPDFVAWITAIEPLLS